MKKFLLSDLFFGILLTLFVAGSYVTGSAVLESLELKFYDMRAGMLQTPEQPPTEVAVVAIDDDSLAQLGRWPWPRGRVADMVEKLNSYGPKVIGLNILFTEPDQNPAIAALDQLAGQYKQLVESKTVSERANEDGTSPVIKEIEDAKLEYDQDAKLAAALMGKKVVLPMFFDVSPSLGGNPEPLPEEVSRSKMVVQPGLGESVFTSESATVPLALFTKNIPILLVLRCHQ
jgi:eukaryotic-like serine/threonine-protein kinase